MLSVVVVFFFSELSAAHMAFSLTEVFDENPGGAMTKSC